MAGCNLPRDRTRLFQHDGHSYCPRPGFQRSETADSKTRGVVISEKTAKHYWPNRTRLGKRLKPGVKYVRNALAQVIGVVKDVRQNDFIAAAEDADVFQLSDS